MLIALLVFVNAITNLALGQQEKQEGTSILSVGIGIGDHFYWKRLSVFKVHSNGSSVSADVPRTIQTSLFAQLEKRNHFFKLRYSLNAETEWLFPTYDFHETLNEFALIYGMAYKKKIFYVSGGCGLSVNSGIYRKKFLYSSGNWLFDNDHYEKATYATMGIPFEATAGIRAGTKKSIIGLNMTFIGNLGKNSVLGFNVGIQLGYRLKKE